MFYFRIRLIIFVFFYLTIVEAQEIRHEIVNSFKNPGLSPQSLAWDGKFLWILDDSTDLIYKVNPSTGKEVKTIKLNMENPSGLTYNDNCLYVSESKKYIIHKITLDSASFGKIEQTVEVEYYLSRNNLKPPIKGLTWKGENLFYSIFAGWSSTVVEINFIKNVTIKSFFCHAEDLAFDGKNIWCTSYQSSKYLGSVKKYDEKTRKKIGTFKAPGYKPTGLTYGDQHLWLSDKKNNLIYKIKVFE